MTYNYNEQHHSKITKAGMQRAKEAGKTLGRPKGGKIKGEDRVLQLYQCSFIYEGNLKVKPNYRHMSLYAGVSKGTVQKIINKYKNK